MGTETQGAGGNTRHRETNLTVTSNVVQLMILHYFSIMCVGVLTGGC